jgi:nucleobase:cation symporter-1, NCS1 family
LYTAGFNASAWVAWVIGVGLAFYWTRVSPLSFGATVPVFVLTFALYLLVRLVAGRVARSRTVSEPDRGVD